MTSNKEPNEALHNWIFHYNPWTGLWNAFPREKYLDYFNNQEDPTMLVIRSKEIKTLVDILYKINGDPKKIKDL